MSTIGSLLPPACCLCGARGIEAGFDLCSICLALLPGTGEAPAPHLPHIDHALVPFHYAYPIDHFIRALKFRGERVFARVMGELLARAVRHSRRPLPETLVPVPLHSSRYRSRGFNQAQEIARYAGARLNLPVDHHALVRVIATREQSGLTLAERRLNIRGVFRVIRPLRARRVALVDDVLTTGGTASEAARTLRAGGAAEIELWGLARVAFEDPFDYRPAVAKARPSHALREAR